MHKTEKEAKQIEKAHLVPLAKLYALLDSSEKGLSAQEAEKRIEKYGPNELEQKSKADEIKKFLKNFTNFFALLLMFGSLLSFLGEYLEPGQGNMYIGIALIVVVFINAFFTYIQEHQSEKIMQSFKQLMPDEIFALRGNKKVKILAKDLVPGDIIFLEEGNKIPADARLIKQTQLKVDNSSLTGESEPQLRSLNPTSKNILESRNVVFSGTAVQSGNGLAIVFATGQNTQIGKIAKLTKKTETAKTPLHIEIDHFIRIISTIAVILGIVFFIISMLLGKDTIASLIFAIGIIVANVPEGLLPTVTLSLSLASKRMAKKNALIKNLESVETLGSTTVICTDKTGTITENKMSLNTIYINFEEFNVYEKNIKRIKGIKLLSKTAVLCNNARYNKSKGVFFGDPTETSLLDFAKASKIISLDKETKQNKRIKELPFDSKRKRMSVIVKGKGYAMYTKGAPEVILKRCTKVLINNKVKRLSKKEMQKIEKYYIKLASRGERILALAYREIKQKSASKIESTKEDNLIFIGLIGIIDPPRKGVKEAVKKCHDAGIRIIMITGDNGITAETIARKVGIIKDKAYIVNGSQLSKMKDKKLKQVLKKENLIFARTSPIQKLRITKALQEIGEIVTVTGDGVNDAPALKNADMGVAMGSGTDVAKEASDMVLLDDHFATIVTAVEQGRTIYANIKKFISYILTSNIPEILPFIAYVLFEIPLPLTVVLILSIDLGTDLLPALGLAKEAAEDDVMKSPPISKNDKLLNKDMLKMSYGLVGMLQAAAGFIAYFLVLYHGGWHYGQQLSMRDPLYLKAVSAFFISIIIAQIGDVLRCRTRRQSVFKIGLFKNRLLWFGILFELVLMYLIVYTNFGNKFLGTAPVEIGYFAIAAVFAGIIFLGDELRKYLLRKGNVFVKKHLVW